LHRRAIGAAVQQKRVRYGFSCKNIALLRVIGKSN